MDLYQEILAGVLAKHEVRVTFPDLQLDPAALVDSTCYQALCAVKRILEDDSLSDKECFYQIEEIVGTLEALGSDAGARHDFG